MKSRIVSALVALVLFILAYRTFGTYGLLFICAIVALVSIREYAKLTLKKVTTSRRIYWLFYLFCTAIYFTHVYLAFHALAVFALLVLLFLGSLLYTSSNGMRLLRIVTIQGWGVLGFIYCGILPALTTRLLQRDHGDSWFFTLMAIVFVGDTMAYLVGKVFGRHLLMPKVSPKKTIEGSLGGLLGSCAAGYVCSRVFFPGLDPWAVAGIAIPVGVMAQLGDLFESLLKRVSREKDSGSFMPGHGGMLDRMDGIFFGAPLFYILLSYWSA